MNVIASSIFLQKAVAIGKSSLAPRAPQLFPQTSFVRACTPLFNSLGQRERTVADKAIAEYWETLCQLLPPWKAFRDSLTTAADVRNATTLTSTAVLVALGQIGAIALVRVPDNLKDIVGPLSMVDWSRNNSILEGAAIQDGVLLRGEVAENQTHTILKEICKLGS
jgi:DndB-like DNA-sulfur modification-associated protein